MKTRSRTNPARTEAVFDFVAFAGKSMPLSALLDGAPSRFASILGADVVSIYLREGGGDGLVLRGNVGFDKEAQGRIRLSVGEGLTGLAVQRKEVVNVTNAHRDQRFRGFAELDEERFPILLAVPILAPDHAALGALVVQRKARPFEDAEVALAAALTAPIAYAVRHAALLDDLRDKATDRKTGGGTRKVTLPGRTVVAGRALGAIAASRRPAQDRAQAPRPNEDKLLRAAFESVRRDIERLDTRARKLGLSTEAELSRYALIALDARLLERALELVAEGMGSAQALSTVAREVSRAATGIVGDPYLERRARDIEDVCDAILMFASPDARAAVPAKCVMLCNTFSIFELLVTTRYAPSGVAVAEAGNAHVIAMLRLFGVPAILGVSSAFRWASPGEVALLDADHGFLVVNPSRAEIAALRAYRRKRGESLPPELPPAARGEVASSDDLTLITT